MDSRTRTKIIKLSLTIIIIIAIIFTAIFWFITYNEEGETNIPFKVSKIVIVSSTEGISNATSEKESWSMNINQNNDIYLYIDKNQHYGKTELIESVKISNFDIVKESDKGETKIYKTTTDENQMFRNTQEFEVNELKYKGALESNIKQSKISNQGGLVVFRCANNNIAQYAANDVTEVRHNQLLQMTDVNEQDIRLSMEFDLEIKIVNRKTYKATVSLQLPVDGVIAEGTTSLEITDLEHIVFKII